jgi:hypothetical protein
MKIRILLALVLLLQAWTAWLIRDEVDEILLCLDIVAGPAFQLKAKCIIGSNSRLYDARFEGTMLVIKGTNVFIDDIFIEMQPGQKAGLWLDNAYVE